MHSKLLVGALILIGATTAACKKAASSGAGGSGGATSSTTATSSTGKGTTAVTTTGTTATASTGGLSTCDSIGKCTGDGMTPSSGCVECAVIGTSMTATDGGKCTAVYTAAYGTDAQCTGGQAGVCTYVACRKTCDPTLMFMTKATLDCLCTNDGTKCLPYAMQTNPQTCRGALYANMPAYMAYQSWLTCAGQTCQVSCGGGGG